MPFEMRCQPGDTTVSAERGLHGVTEALALSANALIGAVFYGIPANARS